MPWAYLDVARKVGDPAATRAVGTANGMNRLAIVIPCYRVVNRLTNKTICYGVEPLHVRSLAPERVGHHA
jgi:O-6-methylguanine DNA methyltransferase